MTPRLCAGVAFLLGMLGLSRWVLGVPARLFTTSWDNMTAPGTAVMLMALGACAWSMAGRTFRQEVAARRRWGWTGGVGAAATAVGAVRLAEIGFGADLGVESTFQRVPRWGGGPLPAGTMAFPTALCVVLSGSSTVLLSRWAAAARPRVLAGWFASAATAMGVLFGLGYWYGHPLTYAGRPVAMAANTALACMALGAALALLVSRHERWGRARMLERLRRARESLERRVGERTAALRGALEALRDETEARRRTEASLVHAQKMESIGRLAAGIAHDFNNYLTAIQMGVSMAEGQPGLGEAVLGVLRRVSEATVKATALAARLLAFARKPRAEVKAPTAPGPLLEEVVSLVRPMLGGRIVATVTVEPSTWRMLANAGELQQVMVNLCINARDAMPGGGELRITASNTAVRGGLEAAPEHVPEGEYVILEVKDTGTGMSPEVAERAFEPFFTTKAELGTGLGLATSYGIVRAHGGRITLETEPGVGTRFRVFVPRA